MRKKAIAYILTATILISVFSIRFVTANAEIDEGWEYTVSNGEATVTRYRGKEKDLVVPERVGGFDGKVTIYW